jgi:DNA-binding transcriptional regulator GbsR (MarR family)
MARLNKSQKYAILWLNSTGMSVDDISRELELEIKQINNVLEKNINVLSEAVIPTKAEPVNQNPKTSSKDLMIRHTAAKKTNSVAIMTKEASEINDHARNQNQMNPNIQKNIFRPNG